MGSCRSNVSLRVPVQVAVSFLPRSNRRNVKTFLLRCGGGALAGMRIDMQLRGEVQNFEHIPLVQ